MQDAEKVLWDIMRNSDVCDDCAAELRRAILTHFPHVHQDNCACHACSRRRKQRNPDNGDEA